MSTQAGNILTLVGLVIIAFGAGGYIAENAHYENSCRPSIVFDNK